MESTANTSPDFTPPLHAAYKTKFDIPENFDPLTNEEPTDPTKVMQVILNYYNNKIGSLAASIESKRQVSSNQFISGQREFFEKYEELVAFLNTLKVDLDPTTSDYHHLTNILEESYVSGLDKPGTVITQVSDWAKQASSLTADHVLPCYRKLFKPQPLPDMPSSIDYSPPSPLLKPNEETRLKSPEPLQPIVAQNSTEPELNPSVVTYDRSLFEEALRECRTEPENTLDETSKELLDEIVRELIPAIYANNEFLLNIDLSELLYTNSNTDSLVRKAQFSCSPGPSNRELQFSFEFDLVNMSWRNSHQALAKGISPIIKSLDGDIILTEHSLLVLRKTKLIPSRDYEPSMITNKTLKMTTLQSKELGINKTGIITIKRPDNDKRELILEGYIDSISNTTAGENPDTTHTRALYRFLAEMRKLVTA
jgi:hypothetical protein